MSYENITEGMSVYGPDNKLIGKVERREANGFRVGGRMVTSKSISRVDSKGIYLASGIDQLVDQRADASLRDEGTIRVPVREERLDVEKRMAETGEVTIEKTVTQEQVSVPVELRREEVHVEERDVTARLATDADMGTAFEERTIRVPVRGEEAVVDKEVYVTGEVVVSKNVTTERQEITDTVRREHIDVDEDYQRARSTFQQHYQERARTGGKAFANRPFEQAEETYRYGFERAYDDTNRTRDFDTVEPELRREYTTRSKASGRSVGEDEWQHLREEIREGYNRARNI